MPEEKPKQNGSYGMYRMEQVRIVCPYTMGSNPIKDIRDTKRELEIYMIQTRRDKIILVLYEQKDKEVGV